MGKKFNVGDKVKVVKGNYAGYDDGYIGIITTVRPAGMKYEVKFDRETEFTHHGEGHKEMKYRYYNAGNLELVEEKTYTTKYNPGDEVTVRSDMTNKAYYMADGKGYMTPTYQMLTKRGKKVKIKSVTKTGKYMIEGSIFPWVDEMFVDEAKEEPKTYGGFKVGDRVKTRCHGGGTVIVIDEGSVGVEHDEYMNGHDCCANSKGVRGKKGYCWWYNPSELTHIPDEPKEEVKEEVKSDKHSTTKFKVGDKIKAIDDHYGITCLSFNWVGIVTKTYSEVTNSDWNFEADTLNKDGTRGGSFYLNDSHFELVEETKESKPKNDNWKVVITPDGDKTTLEYFKDGKVEKTVTVNRYHEDEYSANAAIKATVDKLMLSEKFAVTVKFDTGKGEYTYLTDDTSIMVDDIVVVPTGKFDNRTLARVTSVTPFLKAKITVPLRDLKYVIEKSHPSFKVGDNVIAKKDAPYGITTNGWKGVVTYVDGMSCIKVGELNGLHEYTVNARYFDLLEESPKETETKKYNGKVVCVSKKGDSFAYTVGKVYEFIDGRVKIDNGCSIPCDGRRVATLEEWNESDDYKAKFIPFVE
jgi:uncharacterized protein YlzI (FlbEa/FlbD family)/co-chaperonin GroES (HSP10)